MAEIFRRNPDAYVDMNDLFSELSDKVGLTSEQWRKAIENANYLYQHLGLADVEIGRVSTVFTEPATLSDVQVEHREVTVNDKTTDYFDFTFYIPSPKIQATLTSEKTNNAEEVGMTVEQIPIYGSGANSSTIVGYEFKFNAKFLAMDIPIITTITETSTDTEVPSAKAVYDLVGNVEALLRNLNSGTGV